MSTDFFNSVLTLKSQRIPFAIATVIKITGSASAKPGSKALIDEHGKLLRGWVGGGCAQSNVCEQAQICIKTHSTTILDLDLDDEILGTGMPCGGHMSVYIEPILPNPVLWILGHGLVAQTLCQLANTLDFSVIVNDPSATTDAFPEASKVINQDIDYQALVPTDNDYVVIATQHKGDHESLQVVLNTNAKYIGLIASKKRAGLVLDYLKEMKYSDQDIARVTTPCGLHLNPQTPQEIALSIMAQIVQIRRENVNTSKLEKLT